jgi:hypothetical protein
MLACYVLRVVVAPTIQDSRKCTVPGAVVTGFLAISASRSRSVTRTISSNLQST